MLTPVSSLPQPDPLMAAAERYGQGKLANSRGKTFALAVMAGLYIGIAFAFYITVVTGAVDQSWGLTRLAGGLVFSLGLILVVLCGAELFTSTVLTVVPWANGRVSTARMLRHWGVVFAGNLTGALTLVGLMMLANQGDLYGGQWGLSVMNLAQHKLEHSFLQAVALGILCNLLVCLGVWMSFSTKDPLGKALLLMLPVAMFVSTGFEHSIANLFLVPLGIAIRHSQDAVDWLRLGLDPSHFAHLTLGNFLKNNLLPVTLGNIIGGGALVGLAHWWIHGRTPADTHFTPSQGDKIMTNTKQTAGALCHTLPLTLSPDTPVTQAARQLLQRGSGAALVVENDKPLGFVDDQDLLRAFYLTEFEDTELMPISKVMQPIRFSCDVSEPLTRLACSLAVDEKALYPVSDAGYLTSFNLDNLEQRAMEAVPRGSQLVVVTRDGRLAGVIERRGILAALTDEPWQQAPQETAEVA
ncbi:formate transporter FocA [Ferrimonas sediminicola]|uniref:Formate transporter FocA n=1 Tax=Ferrimonas sediminicola TaxID=2569538 RepID=A0A4U1B8H9_9GAMM|nr:formate transporter FocA [Ferrimonas sediminicola]TKB46808.1 formate transporter FocA [Ferrimonas sediminicola]